MKSENLPAATPQTPQTRLSPPWLLPARLLWLAATALAIGLFIAGLPERAAEIDQWYRGEIQASLLQNQKGQVVISPWPGFAATHAGVLEGDTLLAVNAVQVTSKEQAEALLAGAVGAPLTISVRTGNFPARQVTILRSSVQGEILQRFGLSRGFAVIFVLGSEILFAVLSALIAFVIFWLRSDDWMALFASLILTMILIGLSLPVISFSQSAANSSPPLMDLWFALGFGLLLVFFYLFPNGQFVSRLTLILTGVLALWTVLEVFDHAWYPWYLPRRMYALVMAAWILTGALALAYRYFTRSEAAQRQQIRWVILGAIASAVGLFLQIIPLAFELSGSMRVLYDFGLYPLGQIFKLMLPISISFSVLCYRLWDIDFIINRSLVYGAMTTLLAILFGGSLFLVSLFVQGQSFVIAFGVTAMVAGTSFNPTRRRIQRFVDQRFYNIQIDYQKTPPAMPTTGATQILRQTHFGQYQNLELIGRGGMAEVYRSTHPTLKTPVAIKILPSTLAAEAGFRQRFVREAQVISTLTHPNIVRIFDSGDQDGQLYMVMEYLAGKDLDQLIKTHGRLSLDQALPLIQQIASALDYAHAAGFVHRDIKPSNVLLDSNEARAVLTDFGIAKINNAHTVMTATGYMLGTFDYVAPEQIQESSNVDGRADIYALGVMVYQMLTGELPFKHSNPGALLIAHLTQPAPDACEMLPDLPRHIGAAIQRAMAKKPEDRFGTATEFAQELVR